MKLHVVFDPDGQILGAAHLDKASAVRARPIPNEEAGHRAADVYVPAEYGHYDLAAICQRMKVDADGDFPTLTAKSNARGKTE
jgi:hypothetical protein